MWKKLLLAALLTIGSNLAQAQVATTLVPINNTTWTDLGAGPYQVYSNGTAVFAIGDTTPSLTGNVGFPIPASASLSVSTNSHVWAKATTAFATNAIVAPIVGLSGGGGGGGGGVVTQGAQDATAAAWAMKMAVGAASDGWNITVGAKSDTAWDGVTSSASEMAYLRYIAINSAKPIVATAKRLTLTTAQQLGTGARSLGYVQCYNPSAAVAYVQVLDANPPTLGSTVPISSIGIVPSQTGGIALGTMAMGTTTALYVASTTTPTGSTTVSMECNFGYF